MTTDTKPAFDTGFSWAIAEVLLHDVRVCKIDEDSIIDTKESAGADCAARVLFQLGIIETDDGSGGDSACVVVRRSDLVARLGKEAADEMIQDGHSIHIPQTLRNARNGQSI